MRVHVGHDPAAAQVTEYGAFTADGLGDQGELTCAVAGEECGRMELYELHVGQRRPGLQRQGDAVAADGRRIRAGQVGVADPAGGQHDGASVDLADGRVLLDEYAGDVSGARLDQADGPSCHRPDAGELHCLVECAMNFGAAGIAAGMDNPVAVVATFEGSRQ